jgi:hypothetical protein
MSSALIAWIEVRSRWSYSGARSQSRAGGCSRPGPCHTSRMQRQELERRHHAPRGTHESLFSRARDAVRGDSGIPLERATRETMESRFGHDFSRVRVHADRDANDAAASLGAHAFTFGTDIAFAQGHYRPQHVLGGELLAHELSHVVEQRDRPSLQLALDPQKRARDLATELEMLLYDSSWAQIRKRAYPAQSAAGITAMKQRKAGTLPELPGALGKIKAIERFAAAIRRLQTIWETLTKKVRTLAVGAAVGDEMEQAGVPRFRKVEAEEMSSKGYFDPSAWRFAVNEQQVQSPSLSDADGAELANTAFHEARHAEQHFVGARYAAGILHHDAATIAAEGSIEKSIAQQAVSRKFSDQTDPELSKFGEAMYDAHVTHGETNQGISDQHQSQKVALEKKRHDAYEVMQKLRGTPTDETVRDGEKKRDALRAEVAKTEKTYGAYRQIPYEVDSHLVGDATGEAFQGTL